MGEPVNSLAHSPDDISPEKHSPAGMRALMRKVTGASTLALRTSAARTA
jgi:hypothetical protein